MKFDWSNGLEKIFEIGDDDRRMPEGAYTITAQVS